jgi:hypothetical protein
MPAESAAVTSIAPAKPRPNKRRVKVRIDKRYALGRRVKELEATFRARLGADALDPVTDTAIRRAAEMVALAEAASARALRADPRVSMDDVVRLQRAADLAVRRLHLDRHKSSPAGPSLAHLLREAGP